MTGELSYIKDRFAAFRQTFYNYEADTAQRMIAEIFDGSALCCLCHPFGGIQAPYLFDKLYKPLFLALPDGERRDFIVIADTDDEGHSWIGCAGHYIGRFMKPFINIPPTGHVVHMRYHEFFRFEEGCIVEVHMVWDIPELMMQAGVWPMGASLGREWHIPSPASQDGIITAQYDRQKSTKSKSCITAMLEALSRYPSQNSPEVMQMKKFWHPRFNWYGPAGIGTSRGIAAFRSWHQFPFLTAMPDRGQHPDQINLHFLAEQNYVGVTGWPNMCQTLKADGWLGIVPTGQKITLRSLDFWRLEDGLIRENWVLVDLLDVWAQLGVNVLSRMGELASARPLVSVSDEIEAVI